MLIKPYIRQYTIHSIAEYCRHRHRKEMGLVNDLSFINIAKNSDFQRMDLRSLHVVFQCLRNYSFAYLCIRIG